MLLKILGTIDLISALAFLMLIFGFNLPIQLIMFCAGLLLMKGMFVLTGDVLSIMDIASSIALLLSIFLILPVFLLWIPAFLLLAKGFVSLV